MKIKINIASRNPVASNAWRYNKGKVVPAKKGRGTVYKRVKRVEHENEY